MKNFVLEDGQIMSLSFQKISFINKVKCFFFFSFRKQLDPQVVIILCAHLCLGIKQFQ